MKMVKNPHQRTTNKGKNEREDDIGYDVVEIPEKKNQNDPSDDQQNAFGPVLQVKKHQLIFFQS
jgi:hypothetical protein